LIIGGSKTYHGAPILAAKAAVRFCDLVYFYSTKENNGLARKMKFSTPNVIVAPKSRFKFALSHADCVLVGNGMDADAATRRVVGEILRTKKRCVIDAAAIRVLPGKLLHQNVIVTPHRIEFRAGFGMEANEANARAASKKQGCTILFKGKTDIIASNGRVERITGGNAGMTKGGTGDVLAGLCAALFSTCPCPLRAAYTASKINKQAGELLFRKYRFNFSSEDLADELARAASRLYG
jgi:NAD(P)H-hydrate epimerase